MEAKELPGIPEVREGVHSRDGDGAAREGKKPSPPPEAAGASQQEPESQDKNPYLDSLKEGMFDQMIPMINRELQILRQQNKDLIEDKEILKQKVKEYRDAAVSKQIKISDIDGAIDMADAVEKFNRMKDQLRAVQTENEELRVKLVAK